MSIREQLYREAEEEMIGRKIENKPSLTGTTGSIDEKISSSKHDHLPRAVSPAHYKGKNMEVIDVIDAFDLDLYQGSIVQYIIRFKSKDGVQDLLKAQWYLNRLIQKEKAKQPPPF